MNILKDIKLISKLLISSIGSILLSLPYIYRMFGPTEGEVILWGKVSFALGLFLLIFTLIYARFRVVILKLILIIGLALLVIIQVPPTFLWFVFNGYGISDFTYESEFTAHWVYSIPHILLILISIWAVVTLYRTTLDKKNGHIDQIR